MYFPDADLVVEQQAQHTGVHLFGVVGGFGVAADEEPITVLPFKVGLGQGVFQQG